MTWDAALMKAIILVFWFALTVASHGAGLKLPGPPGSGNYGERVQFLPNGNFVVTDPAFDLTSPFFVKDVGAVYLYDSGGALISRLTGSQENDQVGNGVVVVLANGNFVVESPGWKNGSIPNAGAVTLVDGATGLSGEVSSLNSLVGSSVGDAVGTVVETGFGAYLVVSSGWDDGLNEDVGAVTWCDSTVGRVGTISSANSRVGSQANDRVGNGGVTRLSNGHCIVISPDWDNGSIVDAGAVSWADGASPATGAINAMNSFVAAHASSHLGSGGVVPLTNGNYVISSPKWNGMRGAATWGNGISGSVGTISASNSFVGGAPSDAVSNGGITPLNNSHYVISSRSADNAAINAAGGVTWGSGASGRTGTISAANSLMGSTANDAVGLHGVTALNSGNYVVSSGNWDNGGTVNAGAVTWCDGTSGSTVGTVSPVNSLVGSVTGDQVGSDGSVALSNGNFVAVSSKWSNGASSAVGAVTWGDGFLGISGAVDGTNSIIGSSDADQVGFGGVVPLASGNYVISSPFWDSSFAEDVGNVTFLNGTVATSGNITSIAAIVGASENDGDGMFVTALNTSNYVVTMPQADLGSTPSVGAVTFGDGTSGTMAVISPSVSLMGSGAFHQIGDGGIIPLSSGNYAVQSPHFGTSLSDLGAVTLGNGSTGTSGFVSAANSLVGVAAGDSVGGNEVIALSDGNYLVQSFQFNAGSGALTFCSGTVPVVGAPSLANSIFPNASTVRQEYRPSSQTLLLGDPETNLVTLWRNNVVEFEQDRYFLTEGSGTSTIAVQRTGSLLAAQTVRLYTISGTAVSPADYRAITPETFTLPVGVSTISVPITVYGGGGVEGQESFLLVMDQPSGTQQLGFNDVADITVLENSVQPVGSPVFTSPLPNQLLVMPNPTDLATGTATDIDSVIAVEVSLNGSPFTAATLSPSAGTTVTWSQSINPRLPRNVLLARSIDSFGNVSAISSVTFAVSRELTVGTSGPGNVGAGFQPTSLRTVGNTLAITARPDRGALFNGWTAVGPASSLMDLTPAMLDQATVVFTMRPDISLTANFVSNPYGTGDVGTYNGLISADPLLPDRVPAGPGPEDGTTADVTTEGHFQIKLLANAAFTGRISVDGTVLNVAGSVDGNGVAHFGSNRTRRLIVARKNKPSLAVEMGLSAGRFSGTVSALNFNQAIIAVSSFTSHRNVNATTNPLPPSLLATGSKAQLYTCLLPTQPVAQQPSNMTAMTYPQGDGYFNATLSKSGALAISGTLADGTKFTSTSHLDHDTNWRLFVPLYAKKGYLSGEASFATPTDDADIVATNLWSWSKPVDLKQQYYSQGWSSLQLGMLGSKYVITAGRSVLPALGGSALSAPDSLGNASLTITEGKLLIPLEKALNISSANVVNKLVSTDASFTLSINARTARVKGSFIHSDGTKPTFEAIILQKGFYAGAFGFFRTVKPRVLDFTGESGSVELIGR
jgi:hypothetical protein